jgi:putative heme-binding domain-containing protein
MGRIVLGWMIGLSVCAALISDVVGKTPKVPTPPGDPKPAQAELPDAAPALSPSSLPLRFLPQERIALVGNSLAERMNLYGHFEALLHARFPKLELRVRNFARPADAVDNRQRPNSYFELDDPLRNFRPDTFLCFFGFNESFAGTEGWETFLTNYGKYLDETIQNYSRDTKGSPPRFVLVSPIAWEATGHPLERDAMRRNRNLRRYVDIVAEVARDRGLAYVDLFTPTEPLFASSPGMQYTINGCHLNEAGDREVARMLDRGLFGDTTAANMDSPGFQKLRAAVNDKSWLHLQDYRMLNGWYVYGGRRTFDTETFPHEYDKIRAMVALRDKYVAELAQGKSPAPPDDSVTGTLEIPPTRFGVPTQEYSEPKELRYLTPEECIATMKVPDGFEVQPFASEREFPELAKPDQINFDSRGRLWVCCMPTYPQWKPGNPRPNDRLLILEDTNNDGRADKCKVFYDKLHCPTGFEFWNGGVIVGDQPRFIFLKDTDGDDKADVVVHLLDGWASDDTHHSAGKLEYSNGGLLHTLEGVSMSTTLETPWGPFRRKDAAGAYIIDPRTMKVAHYVTPGYGNPWCYVFDQWGQGIVGDGTTAQQHWDSPLSGAEVAGRRGMDPIFNNQGMRPCVGSEFLLTRQFPADVQGQFVYACVINMNGIPRFAIRDQSAGYVGERVMLPADQGQKDSKPLPDDLLASTDKAFRPVDPQIGPDGALWFGDWSNVIIGHMQYSQRDPNRDHQHGRIYRLVYTKNKLLEPVTQFDKSESQLLDQLREYEPRTRYRARRELFGRPTEKVVAAVKQWVAALEPNEPEFDRLRCEALWVLQSHHAVDGKLLRSVLAAKTPQARAAAMHIVADEREYLPGALELMAKGVRDEHPRVRLEAVRGLSFVQSLDAVNAALAVLESPTDPWIDYTLDHTLMALEPVWSAAFQSGSLAIGNERGQKYLADFVARQRPSLVAEPHLKIALNPATSDAPRVRAYASLEGLHGNSGNGEAVFRRVCLSCHKVKDAGFVFGPELTDVAKRLTRRDLIESIIEPSKKLEPKYVTTTIVTGEGKPEVGFVLEKTKESVTLLMAEGKQKTFKTDEIEDMAEMKQSSMPENLAATISAGEFLDVIEYLCTLK